MKLKIEIECNNAVLEDSLEAEIVGIVARFLYQLGKGYIDLPYEGSLLDSNGNTVGTVEVK